MSNAESNSGTPQTFWDHLEELRGCILRMLAAAAAAAAAAFGFKEELFGIVLAPTDPDFIISAERCSTIVVPRSRCSAVSSISYSGDPSQLQCTVLAPSL